jgi:putative Mg2+ transporter-C (MgtC) family protein
VTAAILRGQMWEMEAPIAMPEHLGWGMIAIRLALTMIAGGLIGLNRGERQRRVGLRTTLLVCLAASITMILVNLLFPLVKRPEGLFRIPQGVLSGIGFIGAGAIVRRGRLVEGVTTAATLWFVTIMGMCFGAGYFALGAAAFGLAAFVLWCLKWAERRMGIPRRARLVVSFDTGAEIEQRILAALAHAGYKVASEARVFTDDGKCCEIRYQLRWHDDGRAAFTPGFADDLARESGLHRLEWRPAAAE